MLVSDFLNGMTTICFAPRRNKTRRRSLSLSVSAKHAIDRRIFLARGKWVLRGTSYHQFNEEGD